MRRLLLLLLVSLSLTGCGFVNGESGSLTLRSRSDGDLRLNLACNHAIYAVTGDQNVTALLVDGSLENPTRAVALRIFWTPKAGSTPVSKRATNAAVQVLVFADRDDPELRELGIYGGAGYVFLEDPPGDRILEGQVWDAHLTLTDQSLGFRDRLGTSSLTGRIQLRRDDAAVLSTLRLLGQRASGALAYPRLVVNPHDNNDI
ncbi:hypothetical protein [Mucisphaera calidilacus]|uniref:Uncharacterized protein n=1 Tax=Mucisphaera calidilacus TaxID=2527982 RepID=A0A518BZC8_9BACT|nr:hypothetical protein [Mucisphaera calidilacus]QDU72315.1 hypothetical protein Pan265_21800 [Mucisphaera calidilacus]